MKESIAEQFWRQGQSENKRQRANSKYKSNKHALSQICLVERLFSAGIYVQTWTLTVSNLSSFWRPIKNICCMQKSLMKFLLMKGLKHRPILSPRKLSSNSTMFFKNLFIVYLVESTIAIKLCYFLCFAIIKIFCWNSNLRITYSSDIYFNNTVTFSLNWNSFYSEFTLRVYDYTSHKQNSN